MGSHRWLGTCFSDATIFVDYLPFNWKFSVNSSLLYETQRGVTITCHFCCLAIGLLLSLCLCYVLPDVVKYLFSATVLNKALSSVVVKRINANLLVLLSLLQSCKRMWSMYGSSFRRFALLVIATVHSYHFLIMTMI